jgi:hypothetical protein
MTMGLIHPGTGRGMRSRTIGSRKTVPPRMLRICVRVAEREPRQQNGVFNSVGDREDGSGKRSGKPAIALFPLGYVRCHWESATSASV